MTNDPSTTHTLNLFKLKKISFNYLLNVERCCFVEIIFIFSILSILKFFFIFFLFFSPLSLKKKNTIFF